MIRRGSGWSVAAALVAAGAAVAAPVGAAAQSAPTPTPTPMPVEITQIAGYDAAQVVDVFRTALVVGVAVCILFLAAIATRGIRSR
jgi:amino acid transporter